MFSLPPGTPTELFYILFPSFHPSLLCLQRRLSFFKRALKHDLRSVPDSFLFDVSLMSRSCGWFFESFQFYQTICPLARISNFDFATDVPAILALVQSEEQFSFSFLRASTGSCLSFFVLFGIQLACKNFAKLSQNSRVTSNMLSSHSLQVRVAGHFSPLPGVCVLSVVAPGPGNIFVLV
jgi:hypothetical protein